jgi:hypothetical protein
MRSALMVVLLSACASGAAAAPLAPTTAASVPAPAAPVPVSSPVAATPPPPAFLGDDSFGKHVHEPQLRIGHYSSGDGLTGFVFDRTGAKPKIRMDGTHETLVLEPKSAPLDQTDLVEQGYGVRIRLGQYGQVIYFRGPRADSVRVARDADADPL